MKSQFLNYCSKNILRSLLLGMMAIVFSGCKPTTQDEEFQDVLNRGVIRVGTVYGQASYYLGAQGPKGYEYELAEKFANSLGLELEIVAAYSLHELFPMLDAGEVDILAAGLSVTSKRLENYRFTPSYGEISQKLVFKQGRQWPRNIDQLQGTVTVSASSSHAENLAHLQKTHPNIQFTETDEFDADELLAQVLSENIDYTVVDSHSLAINRRYYPEISVAFTIKKAEPIAWVLSKHSDDALFASLIEFFGRAHHDGTLLTLDDKYYGHVKAFDYVDTRSFIQAIDNKLPKYKAIFEKYGGDIDWRLLAAMSYQESHWDPTARSYTGVRGMMMLTQPTARQMGVKSRLDPEQSIRGGAKYLKRLIAKIPARIPNPDRKWFALASYNIGWGHLEDARIITQRHGGDPDRWIDVKEYLPLLQQRKYYKKTKYGYARGDEPVRYVENIRGYYDTLVYLDDKYAKQQKQVKPVSIAPTEIAPQD